MNCANVIFTFVKLTFQKGTLRSLFLFNEPNTEIF